MKTIKIKSLPLKLVIADIAKSFNCSVKSSCGQYWITIPKKWGQGTIKGINFEGGLGLIQYDCKFKDDLEIRFTVNKIHPLKFLYCIEGYLKHSFENEEQIHDLEQYQCNIVGSKDRYGHILYFPSEKRIRINSVEFDRKEFHKKMECEILSLDLNLKELFQDEIAQKKFYHKGYYSLRIADLFKQIQDFDHNADFVKRIFLEGKAYNILYHQIIQYNDDQQDPGARSVLRRVEIKLIEEAATMIIDGIGNLDNVESIARKVGLNVNKLQDGFKYFYNNTVNGYIQVIRLEKAKELLTHSESNISEIVELVGLSSKSYFSKIFKEKYGISPSEFRQNKKINRDLEKQKNK